METPIAQNDVKSAVLLVSRTTELQRPVLEALARRAIPAIVTADAEGALDFLEKNDCSLVLMDDEIAAKPAAQASAGDAFELLGKIRLGFPELAVVMAAPSSLRYEGQACDNEKQTRQQVVEKAVRAMQAGCRDFIVLPVSPDSRASRGGPARLRLEKLFDTIVGSGGVHTIASTGEGPRCLYKIVGKSPALVQTVNLARKVAPTSAAVLITGESGTGKELISYVVHYNSRRAQGPFVKVNCAALSETLLESELFGHEKGAFTGAVAQRKGRFEMAHGGTLLLDEISETPLRFQANLLRVLEQQQFQRVGGNDDVNTNVRVISTTNKDLLQQIANGQFRQDLYYRLCGVRLVVAPLRQRKEDLEDLVRHFVSIYAGQANRRISRLDDSMMEIFSKYHWPGNVRQLRNVVFTSLVLGAGETLSLADVSWLFDELQPLPEGKRGQEAFSDLAGVPLAQLERQAILETLKRTNGNQLMAAKTLGISDRTLRDKIKRYRQQGCLQPA